MPLSYGRPLCASPRFRCVSSHAAPIVRKTNDRPAKAKPTMYQIPVNRRSLRAVAGRTDVVRRAPLEGFRRGGARADTRSPRTAILAGEVVRAVLARTLRRAWPSVREGGSEG